MELNLFRIKSLIAKEWDEQKKHYLLVWLVYFGGMTIIFTWCSLMYAQEAMSNGFHEMSLARNEFWYDSFGVGPFYVLLLFLAVSSRGSDFMAGATDRQGVQAYLSLPASAEEKFLVRWLFIVPFTYLMFYTAFFVSDIVRFIVCSVACQDFKFNLLIGSAQDRGLLMPSLALQSLFILCSTFWKKNGYIKTVAILVGVVLWTTVVSFTLDRFYENPETEVLYPKWIQDMLNWGIPHFLFWIMCTALTYWRLRDMQLAYSKIRYSTKAVVVLLSCAMLLSVLFPFYIQKFCRVPNENPRYIKNAVWYSLPEFKHLVLEDSLEVYCAKWVPAEDPKGHIINEKPISGVQLDLNLSIYPISLESSTEGMKQGIRITPELYPYLKTELHHDTLHVFFDYPAREKMRHEGKDYLEAMHLYTNCTLICTDSLLSVQNRMHAVVELRHWRRDSIALEGTSFRLRDCQIDALSIQADSSWITTRHIINRKEINKEWNSLILNNTKIGRLHEYQNKPVFWYSDDKFSRVEQALLHGAAQDAPVIAAKQSGISSDITDAFWKTELGFPVKPFWKK